MAKTLPRWMHLKHGRYYLVRANKWHPLSRDLHDALVEYARLTTGPDKAALGELTGRVMSALEKEVAPRTLKNYRSCQRRFLEAFAEFRPEQIRPAHVARFLDDAKDTPSMANMLHSFLRNVFRRAVRWGVIETDPTRDIGKFKTAARDRYISADEYAAIHSHASPTLQCLMDIAYLTGQRIGDVIGLRYADITDAGVFVRQQKTGQKVQIEMTADLSDAIQRARALHNSVRGLTLFHKRDGAPLSYYTIYGHWRRACAAAGIEDAHFHDLRAAAATDARQIGQDGQTLLGHTTESAHKRYLRGKETPHAKPLPARKRGV